MNKFYNEKLSAILKENKLSFEVLDFNQTYNVGKSIKGILYMGISKLKLKRTFPIDDEIPTLINDLVRSSTINEFLTINTPVNEIGWNLLSDVTAFDLVNEYFNPDEFSIKLKEFKADYLSIRPSQIMYAIFVEVEIIE